MNDIRRALTYRNHFLKISLHIEKTSKAKIINKRGIKNEVNTLIMKSLEPKKFILVSFKKQSYETKVSVLDPTDLIGENTSKSV